jgi:predicted RNA binding protein YcfA (HicA-like mRNA interferase family)
MNSKHKKTLAKLLTKPVLKNIKFEDVDKLFYALGFDKLEGSGSRIDYRYNENCKITIHKPHPQNELKPYVVRHLQDFLKNTGIL